MQTVDESINKLERFIRLYKEHPGTTLDMIDSITDVTIEDLRIVLHAAGRAVGLCWHCGYGEERGN